MELFLVGLAAFFGGALVSWVNSLLTKLLLKKKGENGLSLIYPVRMVLSVAYLLLLYLIGKRTSLSSGALLIGGALGLTILLALFTRRLARELEGKGKE